MPHNSHDAVSSLRDRLAYRTEDRLGRALADLLDNPVLTGALSKAFDARERASQAQELAMGALNLPSAADIERLTRRLRSLSQRIEGVEDSVQRMDHNTGTRLSAIEARLEKLSVAPEPPPAAEAPSTAGTGSAAEKPRRRTRASTTPATPATPATR
ncbi:MAG: hypothetical protein FWD42_02325, partial [Solirubrobacterales bacterium]|nr:hypothetical protein [Solirubrobacterales bacterium]